MRLPVIAGNIKRRLLVNFRADPRVIQGILPEPFRPKLHKGRAIAGICLIRLEQIRPAGFPAFTGISSENAAHRIAVVWDAPDGGEREGVFIPRRDTSSLLNSLAGGRIFPGEHHRASFCVRDNGAEVDLTMDSADGLASIHVTGNTAGELPATSCFGSLAEASAFFETGCLGYSVTRDPSRLDGILLQTLRWSVAPLNVAEIYSSYFADEKRFSSGTLEFDHALIMRDIPHEWHKAGDMSIRSREMKNVSDLVASTGSTGPA